MNRVLAQVLLAVGIILIAFGGFQFATNQPKTFTPSRNESLEGALSDLGNALSTPFENQNRADARKTATTLMVLGGIVTVIGGIGLGGGRRAT
jgi:hypothetical protein